MRRVLALDVLACPRCGGRLPVIATVQDPAVVRTLLAHLALSGAADPPGPAPPAPAAMTSVRHSAPLSRCPRHSPPPPRRWHRTPLPAP